jgi:hypothetical protein
MRRLRPWVPGSARQPLTPSYEKCLNPAYERRTV